MGSLPLLHGVPKSLSTSLHYFSPRNEKYYLFQLALLCLYQETSISKTPLAVDANADRNY